jgi:hypothetical protein
MLTKRSAVYVKVLINRQVSGLAKTQRARSGQGIRRVPILRTMRKVTNGSAGIDDMLFKYH